MARESRGTVLVALTVNGAVLAAKTLAAAIGGSTVMFSEAAHSLADTLNEVFLYVAVQRSERAPDRKHPFGYGKERFFWALIAAIGIFVAGGGFSLFEAYKAFIASGGPPSQLSYIVDYAVFGFAAAVEFVSWLRAYRQTREEAARLGRTFREHIRLSPDPSVKTVASEDTVAVIGDLLGLLATGLQQATGSSYWDGIAALLIAGMLVFVAFALALDNRDLIIGEAVEEATEDRILEAIRSVGGIDRVLDLLTMRIGAKKVLVAAKVDLGDALSGAQVEELSDEVANRVHSAEPGVVQVFVDPSSGGADAPHQHDNPPAPALVLAVDGDRTAHRPDCRCLDGSRDEDDITRLEVRRRGLELCRVCKP